MALVTLGMSSLFQSVEPAILFFNFMFQMTIQEAVEDVNLSLRRRTALTSL